MEPHSLPELIEELVRQGKSAAAADVGTAYGNVARDLLLAGFGRVYAVDLWEHVPGATGDLAKSTKQQEAIYRRCLANLAVFGERAVILRGWSHEMADEVPDASLDFVFVDGSHDYESVSRDLKAWFPKLKTGGVVCGHDYLAPQYGVRQAADEFAASLGKTCHVLRSDSISDACFWFEK